MFTLPQNARNLTPADCGHAGPPTGLGRKRDAKTNHVSRAASIGLSRRRGLPALRQDASLAAGPQQLSCARRERGEFGAWAHRLSHHSAAAERGAPGVRGGWSAKHGGPRTTTDPVEGLQRRATAARNHRGAPAQRPAATSALKLCHGHGRSGAVCSAPLGEAASGRLSALAAGPRSPAASASVSRRCTKNLYKVNDLGLPGEAPRRGPAHWTVSTRLRNSAWRTFGACDCRPTAPGL